VRPHSWRYRDYVINSFNADKPYDRFIREQIAGDELFPENPEALVATSFNLLGPDMVDSADQVQRRHNTLNDMTDTTALVFLGQTLGCARCHNHKTEPFSQRDYYQLQAFFTPAKFCASCRSHRAERAAHKTEMREIQRDDRVAAKADRHASRCRTANDFTRKSWRSFPEKRSSRTRLRRKGAPSRWRNQIQETADLLKITEAELVEGDPG
jgi:hypothetical protein